MFNAPRQRALPSPFASTSIDPLASSTIPAYDDVDPWSSAPSPSNSPAPPADPGHVRGVSETTNGVESMNVGNVTQRPILKSNVSTGVNGDLIGEEDIPPAYLSLYASVSPSPADEISVTSLHRLLSTADVTPSVIERVVNIVSPSAKSVSRQQFFVALGLVALAQRQQEPSIEHLATTLPNLPIPTFRSSKPTPLRSNSSFNPTNGSPTPWDRPTTELRDDSGFSTAGGNGVGMGFENGNSFAEEGRAVVSGAKEGWWRDLEKVEVGLIPEKEGWFLTKYRVESDKRPGGPVNRRYSDFVWLLDCLTKRYPFRLLPNLPPKRVGPDQAFLEQRRKGLARFINFIVNHPVLSVDGCVGVFLSEPNFEGWRKRTKVSLEEEATSKKLDPAAEMAIPADLSSKIDVIRNILPLLVESHSKLVVLAEKGLKRLEATTADASRISMTLATLGERHADSCWRNAGNVPDVHGAPTNGTVGQTGSCELCRGVGNGLSAVGEAWAREGEELERRTRQLSNVNIESLKTQRDLYLAFRDLLLRHERLSKDTVDSLRKRVESKQKKLETVRINHRAGWEVEDEKLVLAIEQDNSSITSLLARRVFIKHCLWHELSVVLHSRQSAQATLGWRQYAANRIDAQKNIESLWKGLSDRLEDMPVE